MMLSLVNLKNQKGILTLDYLFALTLVVGFSSILFALSMTLVVAEITQYMTFASARAYIAGHISPSAQAQAGEKKYQQLWNHKTFQPFFKNGWFQVPNTITPGNHSRSYPPQNFPNVHYFTGALTQFNSKILDFRIPFYGSTSDQTSNGNKKGFSTTIGSFLIREPSSQECQFFNSQRWKAIQNLDGAYGAYGTDDPSPISDNGC